MWDENNKPILAIDTMLDSVQEDTKEDWMMDPTLDAATVDLMRPDAPPPGQTLPGDATSPVTADGTLAHAGGIAPGFNFPDNDSLATWGSKLQGAAGNDDLNSLASGGTTLTSKTASTAETCLSQVEGFLHSQQQEFSSMKDLLTNLMQKLNGDVPPDIQGASSEGAGVVVASPAAPGAPSAASEGAGA